MTVKTDRIQLPQEKIMDDITDKKVVEQPATVNTDLDQEKMAALRAKLEAKNRETQAPAKKEMSIKFGVVGSGQAGSRIAQIWYSLGYDAVAINTAKQDLAHITLPDSNKLLLQYGLGGAGKSLEFGREAAEAHREQISTLVNTQLADTQVFIFTFSAGGGSGGGSCETIMNILTATGKPVIVITTLPMESEDAQTKQNALDVLSNLTKLLQAGTIANLIVVDNAKLELLYSQVGQMEFFNVANKAIVDPIDIFNTLSSMPSGLKALDPTEFAKLMLDGSGISIYSTLEVSNYKDDTSIAEAVVNKLDSSLLASGFDISEAKYVGFMVVANKEVWKQIPASSINYALAIVNDVCKSPLAVFKGIYTVENPNDSVMVYTFLSGLSLPKQRIDALIAQTKELANNTKAKDTARNLNLGINTGANETVSAVQKVKDKIAAAKSNLGKLNSNVIDRRGK